MPVRNFLSTPAKLAAGVQNCKRLDFEPLRAAADGPPLAVQRHKSFVGGRNEAVQASFDNDGGGTDPRLWARRARHGVRWRVADHPDAVELPGQLRRRIRLR